jgi:hypothetical protein
MSTRSPEQRAASRAEARRRARQVARGEAPQPELEPTPAESVGERRGGILSRLFPPAPPLPNRPDPLAGFDRTGSMRPVRERLFLLRRNLVAWLVPGVIAFIGFFASIFYSAGLLGLVGTFLLFGALIGAGWWGWQRPPLYGTAAGLLGYVLSTTLILTTFATQGAADAFGSPVGLAGGLLLQALYPAGIGFLGGWYGGYLRRRQTQLSAETRRSRR